jgi:hypothetical protein
MTVLPIRINCFQKRYILLWILSAIFVLPSSLRPETKDTAPRLSASVEKRTAAIGDTLWVTLAYALPEGARLNENAAIGGLKTLTISERTVAPGEMKLRILIDRLESFDLGPIVLPFIDRKGNEQEVAADKIPITVLSNLGEKPEEATLRPIQGIIPDRHEWSPYLLAAAVALVLLGIAGGFFWWRRRRRIMDVEARATDPPHVKAEKEIEELISSGLYEKGNVKAFYFFFSETIRRYMEAIRQFPAAEMTTEEIARFVKTDPSDQRILPLLKQADLVKFADLIPSPDRKDLDIQKVRAYIRQTRPMMDNSQGSDRLQEVRP